MFYVLDENNNRIEAYSKEEVLAMLNQAIADGSLEGITADAAFISKIKCCVTGGTNNVAFITRAKYNELEAAGTLKEDTAYFITDDTTLDDLNKAISDILNGNTVVPYAETAANAHKLGGYYSTDYRRKILIKGGGSTPIKSFNGATISERITSTIDGSLVGRVFELHIDNQVYTVAFKEEGGSPFFMHDPHYDNGIDATVFWIDQEANYSATGYYLRLTVQSFRDSSKALNVWAVYEIV